MTTPKRHALAPADVVAARPASASSPTRTRNSFLRMIGPSLVAWLTATGQAASTLRDRFAAWCREWSGDVFIEDFGWLSTCEDCGKACANVTHLPTSRPCTGPRHVAQCAECVGIVTVQRDEQGRWRCPASQYHYVTRPALARREDTGNQRPAEAPASTT